MNITKHLDEKLEFKYEESSFGDSTRWRTLAEAKNKDGVKFKVGDLVEWQDTDHEWEYDFTVDPPEPKEGQDETADIWIGRIEKIMTYNFYGEEIDACLSSDLAIGRIPIDDLEHIDERQHKMMKNGPKVFYDYLGVGEAKNV